MNAFDRALGMEKELQGFSFKKLVKKVTKPAVSLVKKAVDVNVKVAKGAFDLHQKLTPKPIKTAQKQVLSEAKRLAYRPEFQAVVTMVASAYGMGAASASTFAAANAYKAKRDMKKATHADEMAFKNSLNWMIKIPPSEREKVYAQLDKEAAGHARYHIDFMFKKLPLAEQQKILSGGYKPSTPATNAAFDAGLQVAKTPQIVSATRLMYADGKTPAQVESAIKGSEFIAQSSQPVIAAAVEPFTPAPVEVVNAATADVVEANQAGKSAMPVLLTAASFLLLS